ncbi:MAG: hypothetical protein K6357_06980 [Elusimicrobiota bacterium]
MNYWIFINDEVKGPLSIEEIVNSKYINPGLLVCPEEMDGVKPSNWYFVKELPEFEKYIGKSVAVEYGFDVNEIINSIEVGGKVEKNRDIFSSEDYEEILLENNVLRGKIGIKDKEIEEYKKKTLSLESKIEVIQKKLDKTLDLIDKYEEKLKIKDKEIEQLSREIEEIKNKKQFESKIKEIDEQKVSTSTVESISDINSETEEKVIINELPLIDNVLQTSETKTEVEAHEDKKTESEISDKNLDLPPQKSIGEIAKEDEKKELIQPSEEKTINLEEANAGDFFDPFSRDFTKLKNVDLTPGPEEEQAKTIVNEQNLNVASLSSSPIKKDENIFQVADIKLEVAGVNLDVVESKNIEPIEDSKIDLTSNVREEYLEKKEDNKPLEEIKDEKIKESESSLNINVVESAGETKKEETPVNLNVDPLSNEKFIKETEKNDKVLVKNKGNVEVNPKPKKNKTFSTLFKIFGGLFFIAFFAISIIYILKSDSGNIDSEKISVKPKFPKNDIVQEKIVTDTENTTSSSLNIAKINENVKRSIDIVKNYDLGDGKGNISRWFSNVFSASSQVKEEWNATYLSGNLFVVQYRVLRYKNEPIVYLFEVDVDKNKIVRGINNNAIDLLSGKRTSSKNNVNKSIAKNKKILENLEKDEEMF